MTDRSSEDPPSFPQWGALVRSYFFTDPLYAVQWGDDALDERERLLRRIDVLERALEDAINTAEDQQAMPDDSLREKYANLLKRCPHGLKHDDDECLGCRRNLG